MSQGIENIKMNLKRKIIIILTLILLSLNSMQYSYCQETAIPETPSPKALEQTKQPELQSEITLCLPKDQVPVTLEESLGAALQNNYGIKIIASQKTRDKWLYYNSLSDFLPDISYNYAQTRFGGSFLVGGVVPVDVTATNINQGFAAQWDGFTGLRRYFEANATRSIYKASKKNLELTKDQALILTTRQYYSLLQDKLNIEILQRALQQASNFLRHESHYQWPHASL